MRVTFPRAAALIAAATLALGGLVTSTAHGASPAAKAPAPSWQSPSAVGRGLDPIVKVGARGRAHAIWRTWDYSREDGELQYAYRDASATAWSAPVTISTTKAQRMSAPAYALAVSEQGNLAVVWASSPKFGHAGDPYLSWSANRGATWSKPQRLEKTGKDEGVERVKALFDSDGLLTVAWTAGGENDRYSPRLRVSKPTKLGAKVTSTVVDKRYDGYVDFELTVADGGRAVLTSAPSGDIEARIRRPNGTWTAPTVISPENWGFSMISSPTPVFLPDGSIAVSWAGWQSYLDNKPALNGVVVSRWDAGTAEWTQRVIYTTEREPGFDFEPQIVTSGNRVALVAITPGGAKGDTVRLWRSANGARTWGSPVTVAQTATGNARIAMSGDGGALVAWLEKAGRVAARSVSSTSSLTKRAVIAKSSGMSPSKGFFPKNVGPSIAVRSGGLATFVWSDGSHSVSSRALARTLKSAKPKVAGTAKVGRTLTAKSGSWTKGTKLSYQWFVNGKKIAKATKRTLVLTKAHRGKRITVKVTGKKAGYTSVVKTSKKTAKVR